VLKEVEVAFAEINIDVVGISERIDSRGGVMELLDVAVDLAKTQTNENLNKFVAIHEQFLPTEQKSVADRYPDKYTSLNIVKLFTNKSQNELFTKFGLIKVGDNLYHKVDQNASLDVIKDYIFEEVRDGKIQMDITASFDNKPAVLEEISNNLMRRSIVEPINDKEKYSAYQVAFNHDALPNKHNEAQTLADISTDETYLKTGFISDFYGYVLREKAKGSDVYSKVLSKIDFNDSDISLSEPIDSLEDIEMKGELYDYIRLKKDSSMKYLLPPVSKALTEDVLYTNFPDRKSEYEGDVIIDGNYLVTDPTADEFIKLNGFMYRKVMERPNSNLFARIPQVQSNTYYTTNTDFIINTLEAKQTFDKYGELSPKSVDHTKFQNIVAKSRVNDNMRLDLQELSTLKDKSYTFFEVNNSIVAYKDGVRVGAIRPGKAQANVYSDLEISVSESHRGRGVGTELYLRMFDKIGKENITLYPSAIRTKQAENIYSRISDKLVKGEDGSVKLRPEQKNVVVERQRVEVVKEKEAQKLIKYLSKKYGIKASLKEMGMLSKYGEFDQSTLEITINTQTTLTDEGVLGSYDLGNISRRTIFHEFLHPFVEVLEDVNPELYNQLFKKAEELNKSENFAQIEHYSKEKYKEELVVRYLDRLSKDDRAPNIFQKFLDWVSEFFHSKRKNNKETIKNLTPNTSVEELYQIFKDYGNIKEEISPIIDKNNLIHELNFYNKLLKIAKDENLGEAVINANTAQIKRLKDLLKSYDTPIFQEASFQERPKRSIAGEAIRQADALRNLIPEDIQNKSQILSGIVQDENVLKIEGIDAGVSPNRTDLEAVSIFLHQKRFNKLSEKEAAGVKDWAESYLSNSFMDDKLYDELAKEYTEEEQEDPNVIDKLIKASLIKRDEFIVDFFKGDIFEAAEEARRRRMITIPTDFQEATETLTTLQVVPREAFIAVIDRLESTGLTKGIFTNKKRFSDAIVAHNKREGSNVAISSVSGLEYRGEVFINPSSLNFNTPIHEVGHLWSKWAKDVRPDLHNRGLELVRDSKYYEDIKNKSKDRNSVYYNYSEERILDEALATAIGDNGESFVNKATKSKFGEWLIELWGNIKNALGLVSMTPEQVSKLSLKDFTEAVAIDLLKGDKFETTTYAIQPLLDEMLANKEGKMVSVQTINQILKQKGIKKVEKDIINEVLELEGFKGENKIPFNDFKTEVNMRIMPLSVVESESYSDYGSENVGVEVIKSRTNIYNTDLDHQITGHFPGDFKKVGDTIEFETVKIPGEDSYAVTRKGVELTEDNLNDNVFHAALSYEDAERWIKNYDQIKSVNQGMFGHTRVWDAVDSNADFHAFVAEIQSDSYQKAKAEEMLMASYAANPDSMPKEQHKAYIKWMKASNLIFEVSEDDRKGSITDLYTDISQAMSKQKELKKKIKETESDENLSFNEALKKQLSGVEQLLDGYMKLAKGEEITIPKDYKIGDGSIILPYNMIIQRNIRRNAILHLGVVSSLDSKEVNIVDEVVSKLSIYDKSIEDKTTVGELKEYIKSIRDSGKSYDELNEEIFEIQEERNNARNNVEYEALVNLLEDVKKERVLGDRRVEVLRTLDKLDNSTPVSRGEAEAFRYVLNTDSDITFDTSLDPDYSEGGFRTPQKALERYKKTTLETVSIDPQKYEEYFHAKQNLGKYYSEIMDNASIKDKQFIAHRKNYSERLLREEIRRQAERGMKTLSIPTPRTLALIEGYTTSEDSGGIPYNIPDRADDDISDLKNGDVVEYLDEEHIVINSDSYNIQIAEKDKLYSTDEDEFLNSEIEERVQEEMSAVDKEITNAPMTEEMWEEFRSTLQLNYDSALDGLDLSDAGTLESINEDIGEEYYTLDRDKIEEHLKEYFGEGYTDAEQIISDQGATIVFRSETDRDTIWYSYDNVHTEHLKQPDQYEEISVEDFDINDMTSTEQTVLRKYEGLIEMFKKEREDAEIVIDDKGNEWIQTKLTEEDGVKPVVVFQEVQQETEVLDQNVENISSIFDSQLELLDLYSPKEEVSIKRDIDSCGG
jgi:hypothetical protein